MRVPIVHLYLDVSGSMTECLPYLSAACREPFKRGELKIFAFSTVVSELKGRDLSKAPVQNTWGTDINAVLKHFNEIPTRRRPRVVLIATDGYVGQAAATWLPGSVARGQSSRSLSPGTPPTSNRGPTKSSNLPKP